MIYYETRDSDSMTECWLLVSSTGLDQLQTFIRSLLGLMVVGSLCAQKMKLI